MVPSGLTLGEMACYEVTAQNVGSGECFSARGGLQASGIIVVDGVDDPVVSVPTGIGVPAGITLLNTGVSPVLLDYEIRSWSRGHDGPSPVMSLDGMPAGIPVIKSVLLDPGVPTPLSVLVAMESFEPFNVNEVRLVADLQGLGLPIESQSIIIKSDHTGVASDVPGDGRPESGVPVSASALTIDVAPNPFANGTAFTFSLDQRSPVRVEVFDAAGRLIRGLEDRELAAGAHTIQWNGRDASGQRVSSGVYWVRVAAGSRMGVEKLLTLK